jgi:hypothetical protein
MNSFVAFVILLNLGLVSKLRMEIPNLLYNNKKKTSWFGAFNVKSS